ncbi:MAG: Vacuolar H+transporting two-sector ATPase F subunit [Syntrophus sp. (in: bacteria)]|nr:Vacuolar H+transporting two-sector ATPase F subunit [Syntrophus sp. (in: bacteria)]
MKFYCIADEDTVRGFQLAGIGAQVAATAEEARIAIDEVAAQPDCGIIIITEKVAAWIRPQVEMIRLEREHPLIVEIPGPEGPLSGRKSLREFVQEAVGMSVG